MRKRESDKVKILASKPIFYDETDKENREELFGVYVTNLTTNIRIWNSLHQGPGGNTAIINPVLKFHPSREENCPLCSEKAESTDLSKASELTASLGLDHSQKEAVLNCVALTECRHRNSVKLIWGPPGTGKTKTIASLLFCLFRMKWRTLTCAPTNVAVIGVAKSLTSCLIGQLVHDSYGMGDIILLGNGKRMNIEEHEHLYYNVFLDYRVKVLAYCFAPLSGWKGSLDKMIGLLDDPHSQYQRYLGQQKGSDDESEVDDDDDDLVENGNPKEMSMKGLLKKLVTQNKKENKKKKSQEKVKGQKSNKTRCDGEDGSKNKHEGDIPLTFEEFLATKAVDVAEHLIHCAEGLHTHMPTSCLSLEVLRNMIRAIDLLKTVKTLVQKITSNEECLSQAFIGSEETARTSHTTSLHSIRLQCLVVLRFLQESFSIPNLLGHYEISQFCLRNACLIFCTVSSSAKLYKEGMPTLELVIIDEAAQLKECESSIPLQLAGVRHAVLVGDEKQLPAMVVSKICDKAGFGRSLFERLVTLGHSKHLLNVQYRMHPSISLFPNETFYENRIRDGENVTARAHERHFLKEKFFGSYSFINVTNGKEEFDNRHSRKNIVEVSVLAEILSKLHKESIKSKQNVRVGCISPYKAQVFAIKEALRKTYSSDANDPFSINVRSVDGFQGGEEDIIIISTVRCNGNGSVGFLEDHQRTNVALTRARHCLWILGNGATLLNSGSVWQKLVVDAKNRGCYYNAYEDKSLSLAISSSLIQLGQLSALFTFDSVLFQMAKWKICFSPNFHESINKFKDLDIVKEVVSLLTKLSNGWRQKQKDDAGLLEGASSQLLEWNVVKGPLRLIWTIDIVRENGIDTQAIKVLDILTQSEIPRVAKEFDLMFENYTVAQLNRCLCKQIEGEMVIPMTWPVDANARSRYSSNDVDGKLASQVAAISLSDHATSHTRRNLSGRNYRGKGRSGGTKRN